MQYLPHLAPIDESALVVKMNAYDLVLGLPWFERHNPEIDWARKRLISLRMRKAQKASTSDSADSPDPPDSGTTADSAETDGKGSEATITQTPEIEMLSATLFEKLLASGTSEAFAIRLWQGTGLLGGTTQGTQGLTLDHPPG
jgi:hypothetical protein